MTNAQSFTNKNLKQVDSLLKAIYHDDNPGAAIAILGNGRPVFKKSYGILNLETKEKISSTTNFNIASLTKQFTAMAVLQLAEKNKLSLNDHLSKFFPEINKKIVDAITTRQLLTHSSGIMDHYDYTDTKNLKHAHNADVSEAIKNTDSTYFPPGTSYRYSNTAYCLLALIIEKISGMAYSDYIKKNIFEPLNMRQTTIWNENEKIYNKASGYEYDPPTNSFKRSDSDENIFFSTEGDGGIYTSIDDYLKWIKALRMGKIFSDDVIDKSRSAQFPVDKDKKLSYGYGWFIDESSTPYKVYHSGSNGGFRTFIFTMPEQEYAIVIFSNRTGIDLEKIILEINKILRPEIKSFTSIETFVSFQDCSSIFAACKKILLFSNLLTKNWNVSAMELN